MTSKCGLYLFLALIGSGSLIGACGDGQIGDSRLSSEGDPRLSSVAEPTPDQLDEPAPGADWWDAIPKPDASNTGPSDPSILSSGNAPPDTITQDGATYENFTKTGNITIDADNVTLRNFTVYSSGNFRGINVLDGASGILIEDGEVDGGGTTGDCLRGPGITGRRLNLHHCDDSMKAQGYGGPTVIEHSYFHDVGGGHGDTVQSFESGSNITFRYNTLVGGNTSVFIIHGPIGALYTIENNWLDGGGYTVYCGGFGSSVRVHDNLFSRKYQYGPAYDDGPCDWQGNLYDGDFSVVPHPETW